MEANLSGANLSKANLSLAYLLKLISTARA